MFTGLVECLAEVERIVSEPPGSRLVVCKPDWEDDVVIGASIAVNGCCLTVIAVDATTFAFEAGPETLARTNLGELKSGNRVNLERSVLVGERLGGHFVTGHIDAVGQLDRREDEEEWSTFWFRMPKQLRPQLASKGSIAVDGVSLTLVDVEPERFSVALIPHTLKITTLGPLRLGDTVNLETDLLAKYVQEQLRERDL